MANHPLNAFKYCPKCGSSQFDIQDEKSKKCQTCNFQYFNNASAAVGAFICNSKGQLLLCKRAFPPAQGMLDLPGGFVDLNETAEQALVRELNEELDIKCTSYHYCTSFPNTYLFSNFTVHTLDLFYEVQLPKNSTICVHDDVSDYQFWDIQAIPLNKIGLDSIRHAIQYYQTLKNKT